METKKTNKTNLENKRYLFFEIGLVVALLCVFYAFEWKSYGRNIIAMTKSQGIDIPDDIIPITTQNMPPPPKIEAPVVAEIITITDTDVAPFQLFNPEDEPRRPVDITPYMEAQKPKEEGVVDEILPSVAVEEKPLFMGGDENTFIKWVFSKLVYPEEAIANQLQGKVIYSFVIDKQGNLTDIQLVRGIDESLNKEALRILKMSPKWTPGKQRGKEVKVRYTFPINFQLK